MAGSFVITLREGLEASLIVAIVLAYLGRTGGQSYFRAVWAGVAIAVLLSLGAGAAIFFTVGSLEGRAEQLFEGSAMLLAAGVLTYMVVWMRGQSRNIGESLRRKVALAVHSRSGIAVFSLALVAVVREGIETALFLFAATRTASAGEAFAGGVAGLVVAVGLGFLLYAGSHRLNMRAFFNISGILLVFIAAGMLAYGIHELEEAAVLPIVVEHVWDINWLLNENEGLGSFVKALFGYNGNPSLTEVVAYISYLAAALWYFVGVNASLGFGRRRVAE
ncbi:MAG: iron uptake transporter permease EfeU [Chloroflexota bacterium]